MSITTFSSSGLSRPRKFFYLKPDGSKALMGTLHRSGSFQWEPGNDWEFTLTLREGEDRGRSYIRDSNRNLFTLEQFRIFTGQTLEPAGVEQ